MQRRFPPRGRRGGRALQRTPVPGGRAGPVATTSLGSPRTPPPRDGLGSPARNRLGLDGLALWEIGANQFWIPDFCRGPDWVRSRIRFVLAPALPAGVERSRLAPSDRAAGLPGGGEHEFPRRAGRHRRRARACDSLGPVVSHRSGPVPLRRRSARRPTTRRVLAKSPAIPAARGYGPRLSEGILHPLSANPNKNKTDSQKGGGPARKPHA